MKKTGKNLRKELLKTMIQLSTAGFGLAAALAWNSTIQALIVRLLPKNGSDIWSQFFYAVVVTCIAVIVTYTLSKMLHEDDNVGDK